MRPRIPTRLINQAVAHRRLCARRLILRCRSPYLFVKRSGAVEKKEEGAFKWTARSARFSLSCSLARSPSTKVVARTIDDDFP